MYRSVSSFPLLLPFPLALLRRMRQKLPENVLGTQGGLHVCTGVEHTPGCFALPIQRLQRCGASVAFPSQFCSMLHIAAAPQAVVALITLSPQLSDLPGKGIEKPFNVAHRIQMCPMYQTQLLAELPRPAAGFLQPGRQQHAHALFGEQAEKIAVMEIEGPETADFLRMPETTLHLPLGDNGMPQRDIVVVICPIGRISDGWRQPEDARLYFLHRVPVAQSVQPHGLFAADGPDGRIFVAGRTVQHIAPPSKAFSEIPKVGADRNAFVNGLPHEVVPRGRTLLFGKVEAARCSAAGMFHHRKAILTAQCVRGLGQRAVGRPVAIKLFSIDKADRIEHKMVVEGTRVEVGGYQHLVPFAPQLPGELDPDLMALLRSDFSRAKTLIGVISYIAVHFVVLLLNGQHLPERGIPSAVDTGDEHGLLLPGFLPIARITEHGLQIRTLCFFRVLGVFHHPAHAVLDGPDFGYCHPASPSFSM